jgi:hypothetical protein
MKKTFRFYKPRGFLFGTIYFFQIYLFHAKKAFINKSVSHSITDFMFLVSKFVFIYEKNFDLRKKYFFLTNIIF